MPIFMDIHTIPGVKARDVAEAHQKDMLIQGEHACKCMTYWIDEERENVFCLIEAPGKEAVEEMHSKAHGLIPGKIIEVSSSLVESFLGRIYDPAELTTDNGLKIFHDSSFRILLSTAITDPVLLQHHSGLEKANECLQQYNDIIRKNFDQFEGREVEQGGAGFIGSFASATKALSCALAIQKDLSGMEADAIGLRIAITAGEPVAKTEKLFGEAIQLASYLCTVAENSQIAISSTVREIISKDHFQNKEKNIFILSPQDEALLELLYSKLEANWQNPDFNVTDFCQAMTMSKSQLYRKTVQLFGQSPNLLLKDFRLEKAKEMMKKQRFTISQITFDAGFTSPSYFTKCFKKRYGLLPMAYLDHLH